MSVRARFSSEANDWLKRLREIPGHLAGELPIQDQVIRRVALDMPVTRAQLSALSGPHRDVARFAIWGENPRGEEEQAPLHSSSPGLIPQRDYVPPPIETADDIQPAGPKDVTIVSDSRAVRPPAPRREQRIECQVPAHATVHDRQSGKSMGFDCETENITQLGMKLRIATIDPETADQWRDEIGDDKRPAITVEIPELGGDEPAEPLRGEVAWIGVAEAGTGVVTLGVFLGFLSPAAERQLKKMLNRIATESSA